MRKSFFILWIGMAGLLLFCWIYLPTLSRYRDLKTQEENLIFQVKDLEKKITDLREERDLLKNDKQYLEKVIRDELGLVKPGEVVYKFVQDEDPKTGESVKALVAQKALVPITANVPGADSTALSASASASTSTSTLAAAAVATAVKKSAVTPVTAKKTTAPAKKKTTVKKKSTGTSTR